MKKLLDKDFRYTPSFATDLRKKFRKLRHEQASPPPVTNTVVPISQPRVAARGARGE